MEQILPGSVIEDSKVIRAVHVNRVEVRAAAAGANPLSSVPVGPAPPVDKSLAEALKEIDQVLIQGTATEAEELAAGQTKYTFLYKKRKCLGTALHVAVQQANGCGTVQLLIEYRADVNVDCTFQAANITSTAKAMHLAVQSGNTDIVEELLQARANINARALRDGRDHFCPIHEAAYFRDLKMARFLIENRADVNTRNLEDMSALHVAARIGATDVAEALVRADSDINLRDSGHRTALEAAVESGVFPPSRLHLLAKQRIGDILIVAHHCPSATADFLRQVVKDQGRQSLGGKGAAARGFDEPVNVKDWIELMHEAPEAGGELLKVLTFEPEEESIFYHPLPTQACLTELRCAYNPDQTWKCDTEAEPGKKWPAWHDTLAPMTVGARHRKEAGGFKKILDKASSKVLQLFQFENAKRNLRPVHMRQLNLPGIISMEAMHQLSETDYLEIYRNPAAFAILEYVWVNMVWGFYNMQTMHRCVELAVMVLWTVFPPSPDRGTFWDSSWRAKASWSVLFIESSRTTLQEFWQAMSCVLDLRDPAAYFTKSLNYFDLITIAIVDTFVFRVMLYSPNYSLSEDRILFSWIILGRWVQLLYTLRGYRLGSIGTRGIIPILNSVNDTIGIVLICTIIFCGFWHAFVNLDARITSGKGQYAIRNIGIATFRMLFQQDGDGIDVVLNLGGVGQYNGASPAGDISTIPFMILGQLLFCITVMNIFIAVYTRAYASASEVANLLFLKERATICLHAMMQPKWPPPKCVASKLGCLGRRIPSGWGSGRVIMVLVMILSLAAWAGLLAVPGLHPLVAGLFLVFAMLLWDALLLQRPWEDEASNNFLWWCAPTTWAEDEQAKSESHQAAIGQRLQKVEATLQEVLLRLDALVEVGKMEGKDTMPPSPTGALGQVPRSSRRASVARRAP